MQEEIWKDIPNYEGMYQVSNLGNVKSLNRFSTRNGNTLFITGRLMSKSKSNNGYYTVSLTKSSVKKTFIVHQLVAICFLNHKPCGMKLIIDHINDDKSDNRLENLQIVSARFNACKTQGKYSSKYKGVSSNNKSNKWVSKIRINGKSIYLGCFKNEYDAHLEYQRKLKEISS